MEPKVHPSYKQGEDGALIPYYQGQFCNSCDWTAKALSWPLTSIVEAAPNT